MIYRLAAELIVAAHVAFVVFVVAGAALVWHRPWIAWVHVPVALWGAATEILGLGCPLTPLEQHFWRLAGEAAYTGGFIEHYVLPVLYPPALAREVQIGLGIAVLALNAALYGLIIARARRR